jgi:hypothetical protein
MLRADSGPPVWPNVMRWRRTKPRLSPRAANQLNARWCEDDQVARIGIDPSILWNERVVEGNRNIDTLITEKEQWRGVEIDLIFAAAMVKGRGNGQ